MTASHQSDSGESASISPVMQRLSSYISAASKQALPEAVAEKTRHHILDTLAATISGSRLPPGATIIPYFAAQGGTPEAVICGTQIHTTATNAAMANAMLAHADETDDSHLTSRSHLGCGVVPAAFAMAEKQGRNGAELVRAVALGYDIGARVCHALGTNQLYDAGHSTHTFAPTFGAAAAAGALAGLSADQCRWLLSYTAQQASGVNCWQRDLDHVEKAFDFGGMAGRNGVAAATMVQMGFTGVDDVLSGPRNFLFAFSPDPKPDLFVDGLGERFEITLTNIKKWSVGSPIQAVLDSVQALLRENRIGRDAVAELRIHMSDKEHFVVDNREIPDINVQHMSALMLHDGDVSFESSHDESRMNEAGILAMKARVRLIPDASLERRKPRIELLTTDGRSLSHSTPAVRGTPDNPMTREEVELKARDLIAPILGAGRADELIASIRDLDALDDV
ncbi:MAG: MmgE/PrpD family protein, partial [Gammaproteobacteria bacterium]|nr:MmgE/PrpD family protein [Gammaproteobacteria bacterium]